MREIDVTPAIAETLEWMVTSEVYRQGVNPALLGDLTALGAAHNWSPEMRTAIALLHDLQVGYITCVRDGPTDL